MTLSKFMFKSFTLCPPISMKREWHVTPRASPIAKVFAIPVGADAYVFGIEQFCYFIC